MGKRGALVSAGGMLGALFFLGLFVTVLTGSTSCGAYVASFVTIFLVLPASIAMGINMFAGKHFLAGLLVPPIFLVVAYAILNLLLNG